MVEGRPGAGNPRPRPAPRRRRDGHHRSRPRLPVAPGEHGTPRGSCGPAPDPPGLLPPAPAGSSIACSSCSSPRTATCCSTPGADPAARERYTTSTRPTRLRRLAERRRGTQHADLYRRPEPGHGEARHATPAVPSWACRPWAASSGRARPVRTWPAARSPTTTCSTPSGRWRSRSRARSAARSTTRTSGSEELGSVYESLLELHPELNVDAGTFALKTAAGNERKTTGSYYTPSSLIAWLLDSALDPVLDEAARKPDPEAAILDLKVCDPACGSGHFLIAAAHRIAKTAGLGPDRRRGARPRRPFARPLRDVIGHCVYGVDINPMAVELCKVSLWMEALEPGKPLSFLDHHIQCGNSLLGATPALLAAGHPRRGVRADRGGRQGRLPRLRKQNRDERRRPGDDVRPVCEVGTVTGSATSPRPGADRNDAPTTRSTGVHAKEQAYAELVTASMPYELARCWPTPGALPS